MEEKIIGLLKKMNDPEIIARSKPSANPYQLPTNFAPKDINENEDESVPGKKIIHMIIFS